MPHAEDAEHARHARHAGHPGHLGHAGHAGHAESPTARALRTLELLQHSPGITADRLAAHLGVSERAARRYVGILREAGIPVESTRGPYGGYRVGRGLRVPPLMFTSQEALALVMAVLEGHHDAADPTGPVGGALGKIVRVLPKPVAHPAEAVRKVHTKGPEATATAPDPATTAALVQAATDRHRLRVAYDLGAKGVRPMDIDPWAVAVRHGRWYLLCWSHTADARRVLRVDRVTEVTVLDGTFTPPEDLDPLDTLEAHLAEGWSYEVEVVVEAPADLVAQWLPRSLGRAEPVDARTTRLLATTDEPEWYAAQLTALRAPFRVVRPPELRDAARALGRRFLAAAATDSGESMDSGESFD